MSPSTPRKTHSRTLSSLSTPGTPDTEYVLAQESLEETPTRKGTRSRASRPDLDLDETFQDRGDSSNNKFTSFNLQHDLGEGEERAFHREDTGGSGSSHASRSESYSSDPELLEMLENDDIDTELDMTEEELEDGLLSDAGEPLVSRGRRRRRKRWTDAEENKEKSLFEVRIRPD